MDDKTKRIEELEARTAALAAEIAALKAEAEKPAPKFKVGDTAYVKVTICQVLSDGYKVEDVDGDYLEYPESSLLPAAPALVPVVPGELKPGDEVYVKVQYRSTDSDGDISYRVTWTAFGETRTSNENSIPANVYQVR